MIAAVVVHGLTGKCWMFYGYKANTLTPLEERRQGREKPNPSFSCWLHPAKPPSKDLNQKWGWVLGAGVELDTDTNGPAHETDNSTTAGWLFILVSKAARTGANLPSLYCAVSFCCPSAVLSGIFPLPLSLTPLCLLMRCPAIRPNRGQLPVLSLIDISGTAPSSSSYWYLRYLILLVVDTRYYR